MFPSLQPLLALTAGLAAGLAVLLAVTKLLHREVLRWRGVRVAHYVAVVGEMTSRKVLPTNIPRGWEEDPLFHNAVSDFRLLLTGEDRDFIDRLVADVGIHRVLVERSRRRFPKTRRLRAVATLVDLATPAQRHHLRSLIDDPDAHVRAHAVRGLARLRDIEPIPAVLDVAARAKPWEAARIADALVAMGPVAVEPIRDWVEDQMGRPDGSVEVVALATRVLGLIGDPGAEPVLISLLESNQPDWRVAAASALEHTGGQESIQPLLAALEDRAWRVRARVAVALGAMADPAVARPISGLLYDQVWWVRQNAAAALGVIPGGTDYLLATLEGPDPYAADAALNQLTISGLLDEAQGRVRSGAATDRDMELAAVTGAAR